MTDFRLNLSLRESQKNWKIAQTFKNYQMGSMICFNRESKRQISDPAIGNDLKKVCYWSYSNPRPPIDINIPAGGPVGIAAPGDISPSKPITGGDSDEALTAPNASESQGDFYILALFKVNCQFTSPIFLITI